MARRRTFRPWTTAADRGSPTPPGRKRADKIRASTVGQTRVRSGAPMHADIHAVPAEMPCVLLFCVQWSAASRWLSSSAEPRPQVSDQNLTLANVATPSGCRRWRYASAAAAYLWHGHGHGARSLLVLQSPNTLDGIRSHALSDSVLSCRVQWNQYIRLRICCEPRVGPSRGVSARVGAGRGRGGALALAPYLPHAEQRAVVRCG